MPRMSRAEIASTVLQIIAISGEFGDPGRAIRRKVSYWDAAFAAGNASVDELNDIKNELNQLVTDRLFRSESLPPTIEPSVSVTLWGTNAGNQNQAGIEAMKALDTGANQITLVDRTHVRTADAVGTRYVFRAVSA